MQKALSCVICGNYGAHNIGDEAIAEGVASVMEHAGYQTCFLVADKNAFEHAHPGRQNEYQFPFGVRTLLRRWQTIPKTIKTIATADVFVLGGGGLFHRHESALPLILWGGHCVLAKILHTPYIWYGMSLSDYSDAPWWQKTFFKWCCRNAHAAFLRDTTSRNIFVTTLESQKEAIPNTDWNDFITQDQETKGGQKGIKQIICGVVDDPAITWIKTSRRNTSTERQHIIFGLTYEHTSPELSEWCYQKARELQAQGEKILCVGHTPADISFDWMHDFETVIPQSPAELQSLYECAKQAWSMRLHSFLLAVFCDVPNITVFAYHQKVLDQYNLYKRPGITLFGDNNEVKNGTQEIRNETHEKTEEHKKSA